MGEAKFGIPPGIVAGVPFHRHGSPVNPPLMLPERAAALEGDTPNARDDIEVLVVA